MSAELEVTKRPEGGDIVFEFRLAVDGDTEEAEQHVSKPQYEEFVDAVKGLGDVIDEYKRQSANGSSGAYRTYRENVTEWLEDVGELISVNLLPPADSAFGELAGHMETSSDINWLQVYSSDFSFPWWLARCYTSLEECWAERFPCGFLPREKPKRAPKGEFKSNAPIALLSRPSIDLQFATDPRGYMSDSDHALINVLDGDTNNVAGGRGFGLRQEEILEAIRMANVVFYYGHFNPDEQEPSNSFFEVLPMYRAGRRRLTANGKMAVRDVIRHLQGKFLFVNACRSIGIPNLGDEDYPAVSSLLSGIYLSQNIVCLGTIYPIFDRPAVHYMLAFARAIGAGRQCGEAMQQAREQLTVSKHDRFDWSSYVLLGNPAATVKFDLP